MMTDVIAESPRSCQSCLAKKLSPPPKQVCFMGQGVRTTGFEATSMAVLVLLCTWNT